ncbi:hypothetical protein JHK87_043445 [Glycine soja]|nr:hypothetical protein JHK87_043445 [Glycine soja]
MTGLSMSTDCNSHLALAIQHAINYVNGCSNRTRWSCTLDQQIPELRHELFLQISKQTRNNPERKTKNQRKTKWRRKKQRKKKKKEEEKKPQESKDDKESKEESMPPDIVLKVFMHCEGCACKVVPIVVYMTLGFAFYVFFAPFLGKKMYITSDPADPGVLKSKKYLQIADNKKVRASALLMPELIDLQDDLQKYLLIESACPLNLNGEDVIGQV